MSYKHRPIPPATQAHNKDGASNSKGVLGWVSRWATHRYAVSILCAISFIEASVFPIPPYALLIPMSAVQPKKALYFAGMGTLFSTLGGLLGYAIGYFASDWAQTWLTGLGYAGVFQETEAFFQKYGALSILISAVTPMPYKVLTITSGLFSMNIAVFFFTSLLARGLRFFVAAWSTAKVSQTMQKRTQDTGDA